MASVPGGDAAAERLLLGLGRIDGRRCLRRVRAATRGVEVVARLRRAGLLLEARRGLAGGQVCAQPVARGALGILLAVLALGDALGDLLLHGRLLRRGSWLLAVRGLVSRRAALVVHCQRLTVSRTHYWAPKRRLTRGHGRWLSGRGRVDGMVRPVRLGPWGFQRHRSGGSAELRGAARRGWRGGVMVASANSPESKQRSSWATVCRKWHIYPSVTASRAVDTLFSSR